MKHFRIMQAGTDGHYWVERKRFGFFWFYETDHEAHTGTEFVMRFKTYDEAVAYVEWQRPKPRPVSKPPRICVQIDV